jgi:hypothetical protein
VVCAIAMATTATLRGGGLVARWWRARKEEVAGAGAFVRALLLALCAWCQQPRTRVGGGWLGHACNGYAFAPSMAASPAYANT